MTTPPLHQQLGEAAERLAPTPTAADFEREVRSLYDDWMEDADEDGIISGSAADLCSDVFEMLGRLGLVVR